MAAFEAPPALVFGVSRLAQFEAVVAVDALPSAWLARAVAVGCGKGEAADG